jgi:hypothetical protein
MASDPVLRIRRDEYARRLEGLPREVAAWRAAVAGEIDLQVHHSQLKAIQILTTALVAAQQPLLAAVDAAAGPAEFQRACMALAKDIVRSQLAWDFFRDKLDQRLSFSKEMLWVADTIAWDCHRPVMEEAAAAGLIDPDHLREPPLTYAGVGHSPLTWVRKSRPNDGRRYDLGEATLPIPVIEVPAEQLSNAWELLSLHHEAAHDIESDLGLRPALRDSLAARLQGAGVPNDRVAVWLAWQGEVFADLCALQLGGPAFAEALMHLLLLPPEMVTEFEDTDPHPTPFLRVLLAAAYIRSMLPGNAALTADADRIEAAWRALYVQPAGAFAAMLGDLPHVFAALMDTALPPLGGRTVRSLMPYMAADDLRIRDAAGYFVSGMNKPLGLRPRHVIAAARMALSQLATAGPLAATAYDQLQQRIVRLVREGAPPGLRGTASSAHDRFVAGFAKEAFT